MRPTALGRFFTAGAVTWLVTAALHMLGHLQGLKEPANATEEELFRLVTTYALDFGGQQRTVYDFLRGYSLTFALFCAVSGLVGFAALRLARDNTSLLTALAGLNALLGLGLTAVSWIYFVLPPLVFAVLILVLFGIAWLAGLRGARPVGGAQGPDAVRESVQ